MRKISAQNRQFKKRGKCEPYGASYLFLAHPPPPIFYLYQCTLFCPQWRNQLRKREGGQQNCTTDLLAESSVSSCSNILQICSKYWDNGGAGEQRSPLTTTFTTAGREHSQLILFQKRLLQYNIQYLQHSLQAGGEGRRMTNNDDICLFCLYLLILQIMCAKLRTGVKQHLGQGKNQANDESYANFAQQQACIR